MRRILATNFPDGQSDGKLLLSQLARGKKLFQGGDNQGMKHLISHGIEVIEQASFFLHSLIRAVLNSFFQGTFFRMKLKSGSVKSMTISSKSTRLIRCRSTSLTMISFAIDVLGRTCLLGIKLLNFETTKDVILGIETRELRTQKQR